MLKMLFKLSHLSAEQMIARIERPEDCSQPLIPASVDNMEIFLYQFVSSLGRSERDQMT